MVLLFDLLLLAVIVIGGRTGYKRGFVLSLFALMNMILSFAFAGFLFEKVFPYFYRNMIEFILDATMDWSFDVYPFLSLLYVGGYFGLYYLGNFLCEKFTRKYTDRFKNKTPGNLSRVLGTAISLFVTYIACVIIAAMLADLLKEAAYEFEIDFEGFDNSFFVSQYREKLALFF